MVATKKELIELVAEKAEFTKKDAEKAINATLDSIKELTAEKGAVSLIGFGKFEKRHRAARQGQNRKTVFHFYHSFKKTLSGFFEEISLK